MSPCQWGWLLSPYIQNCNWSPTPNTPNPLYLDFQFSSYIATVTYWLCNRIYLFIVYYLNLPLKCKHQMGRKFFFIHRYISRSFSRKTEVFFPSLINPPMFRKSSFSKYVGYLGHGFHLLHFLLFIYQLQLV